MQYGTPAGAVAEMEIHPVQAEAWSRMSFQEKWELAKMAQRMVIDAARRRIRRDHPEYSDEELQRALAKFLISAHT